MKKFSGYEESKEATKYAGGGGQLPPGAYVCKVLGVKFEEHPEESSDRLLLQFDICEGEYEGFFKKQYEANQREDKKFKGKITIYAPNDNTKEEWQLNNFTRAINAFEDSNEGYTWEWKEKTLKDKIVGIVFGETGTRIEGRDIVYTEARFFVAADRVRNGSAPEAKFKAKNGYGENTEPSGADLSSLSEELPF